MHRSRDAGTWNSIRAAGREETKNPPCQSARRVSENLLGNSKSSLAVFYVEQVALNRHVSPQPQLYYLCLSRLQMSRAPSRHSAISQTHSLRVDNWLIPQALALCDNVGSFCRGKRRQRGPRRGLRRGE